MNNNNNNGKKKHRKKNHQKNVPRHQKVAQENVVAKKMAIMRMKARKITNKWKR
jgi:hypothetical protein